MIEVPDGPNLLLRRFPLRGCPRIVIDGHSRKQVARDLDISLGSLRDWIHTLAPDGPVVSDKIPEAEQLRQLRRENERLRTARDILKRAAGTTTVGDGLSQRHPRP